MSDYFELKIKINPEIADVVSNICFENFDCEGVVSAEEVYKDDLVLVSTTEETLKAYLKPNIDWGSAPSPLAGEGWGEGLKELTEKCRKILKENRNLLLSRGFSDEELGSWEFEISKIENQDWSKKWKENWDVTHVSERIAVVPSWLEYTPKEDEIVINLDPGTAFGTGTHPTTQLCMRATEDYMPKIEGGAVVADIGMGSGILAICALKLGAKSAYGCDNDELVIETAIENARMNDVLDRCVFEHNTADKINFSEAFTSPPVGEVCLQLEQKSAKVRKQGEGCSNKCKALYPSPEFQELVSRSEILPSPTRGEGQFDFVCANILHNVLAEIMGDLKNIMKDGGYMVLSGILDEKKQVVLEAIEKHGLKLIEEAHQDIWTGLVVKN